jgi:hypothetical protein
LVDWAALGADVSFNDDRAKDVGSAYQLQFYGTALVRDHREFSRRMRARYQPFDLIRRPIQVKSCDGSARAISYGFKTDAVRRVAYWGARSSKNGDLGHCWRTSKVSLRAKEHVELLVWLDQIGLVSRVLLYHLRITRNENGSVVLRRRA